jgi:hypothetical protein
LTSLIVSLQSIGRKSISVAIKASCYQDIKGSPDLQFDLPKTTVELRPSSPVSIEIGPVKNPWSYCSIIAIPISDNVHDSLSIDNQAWISYSNDEAAVHLTSPLTPQQLNIAQLGELQVVAGTADSGKAPQIIHRTAISSTPTGPALLVFPPSGLLPWGGSVQEPRPNQQFEITRWVESHPLLQYVKPTLLSLTRSQIIDCPPSATAVITTTAGAVMCAGKSDGVPYAVVGFEIFPFERSKNATVGVLTLNLFKWLFSSSIDDSDLRPLEAFRTSSTTTRVRSAAPQTKELPIAHDRTVTPDTPGVLFIEDSENKTPSVRAVNIFSDQESDLSALHVLTAEVAQTSGKPTKRESFDLSTWFAALGLVILIADLIRRIVNRTRWSRL